MVLTDPSTLTHLPKKYRSVELLMRFSRLNLPIIRLLDSSLSVCVNTAPTFVTSFLFIELKSNFDSSRRPFHNISM